MEVRSGRRPSGWSRGGTVGGACGRTRVGGVGSGRPSPSVRVAAFVGSILRAVDEWARTVRETVRFRGGSVARQIARGVRVRGRWRLDTFGQSDGRQGQGPVVPNVAEGSRVEGEWAEGWPAGGHEEPRESVVGVGEAEPAPVVRGHEAGREEEARRARGRWTWEQFRRGDVVAVVQPNPEVDPEAQPWGIYPSGQPAYVHLDWS